MLTSAPALAQPVDVPGHEASGDGLQGGDDVYSWTCTRNESDGQPLSGTPLHRATASVRYGIPGIGFDTLWPAAFVASRPFYQDDNADGVTERVNASGYASVDARVAQHVGYGLRTFLLGENLLNAGDAVFTPRAAPADGYVTDQPDADDSDLIVKLRDRGG